MPALPARTLGSRRGPRRRLLLLPQAFELEPALLERRERRAPLLQLPGRALEAGRVAGVEAGIGEPLLHRRHVRLGPRQTLGEPVQLALELGVEPRRWCCDRLEAGWLGRTARPRRRARRCRALPQPVRVAAHVLAPATRPLERDRAGHEPVEEVPVVAHEEQGAVIVAERLLE